MAYNPYQQWSPQGDDQQHPQQQLHSYAPHSQPQSPQQPGYQHDEQSLSYSDGANQVHQHMSSTSWSNSTPDHNLTSLPPFQMLQMPQMQSMNMTMGGANMPLALPPPTTPYQAILPPSQQQQGCYPQQGYRHSSPPLQEQSFQLTAPQSPAIPAFPLQGLPYQEAPQQHPPHQLGPPQTPSAAQVTAPAPVTQQYSSPGPDYNYQLQALQARHDAAIVAIEEKHEADRRDFQAQGRDINKRLEQAENSRASDKTKDLEIQRLYAERAAVDNARLEDAQRHRQEMAELIHSQSQAQQPVQMPIFDMSALERVIRETAYSKSDMEAVVKEQFKEQMKGLATKAQMDSVGTGVQNALNQMPRGASEAQVRAAVGTEVTNTINNVASQWQQQRRLEVGRAQEHTPWQQNPRVETSFEITELEEDENGHSQQAPPRSQMTAPQTSRQNERRAVAAAPTSGAQLSSHQISRPVQTNVDKPTPAGASPSAPARQAIAIEGSGTAALSSSRELTKPKKPNSSHAQKKLEYSPTPSQPADRGGASVELQRQASFSASARQSYHGERAAHPSEGPSSVSRHPTRQVESGRTSRQIEVHESRHADEVSRASARQTRHDDRESRHSGRESQHTDRESRHGKRESRHGERDSRHGERESRHSNRESRTSQRPVESLSRHPSRQTEGGRSQRQIEAPELAPVEEEDEPSRALVKTSKDITKRGLFRKK